MSTWTSGLRCTPSLDLPSPPYSALKLSRKVDSGHSASLAVQPLVACHDGHDVPVDGQDQVLECLEVVPGMEP